jgi:dTDP-4-dehydrorhamnose 3,5-epimerase
MPGPGPGLSCAMILEETGIPGACLIRLERREDERGSFARVWSVRELAEAGLESGFVEANTSVTKRRGTIRGLHYQLPPHGEDKMVRCTRGAVFDVLVDLRPESPTRHTWKGFRLEAGDDTLLYVPRGCAHGIQALADDSEIFYTVTARHAPGAERGIRWDDPFFGIEWPLAGEPILSEKDAAWPDYQPSEGNTGAGAS